MNAIRIRQISIDAMTLDNLTRAQAEAKHGKLKNSLARASAEFREHFKSETELFRSLPAPGASSDAGTSASDENAATAAVLTRALSDDLVRVERLAQCCKRVRIWRRQIANPLLQYKHQLLAASTGGKPGGKKSEKRMHITLLMTLIVDIYEQRMHFELDEASAVIVQETFPEFVVRHISQRTSSRRAAVEQLSSVIATVLQAAANHHRVHLFGSLCGLNDHFNPPERIKVFLHILERLHRWKSTLGGANGSNAHNTNRNNTNTHALRTAEAADTAMSDVVFHTIGIPQQVVQKVIADLFQDDFYWNFQFWHTQCSELKVDYRWPLQASDELQERALNLAVSSRNALLNSMRKIDGDAFLALLLDVWTERARAICALLEAATDAEEVKSEQALQFRQQAQDARARVLPLTDRELQLFDELVDEFWNADVPWTHRSVQRKLGPVTHVRPLQELQELYRAHLLALDESRKSWDWLDHWRWETEWEWGVLQIVHGDDAKQQQQQ
ncbi:hypothetical protein Gpo141_00012956 [Globisporangium polare]